MSKTRQPAVAGLFYPGDPSQLRNDVLAMLNLVRNQVNPEKIFGIVSPHAGYIYSGQTASYGFNLLKNHKFDKVIIISPSHREYFPGNSIYDGDAYKTPLGCVEIDKEFAEKIIQGSKTVFFGMAGHRQEHAVEVQIPFLQTVLNDFKIIPIVMGDQSKAFVDDLAVQISKAADEKTVIVASSDLSHFYNKQHAYKLDSIVANRIMEFDWENLQNDLDSKKCEACGGGPIVAMMQAAYLTNNKKSVILHRSDSGDVSGDNDEVVGYLSAVIYSN
ncbi:MAG: AmmeMemoRadiSam system protein B [Ignavibacteriaceae bacterium]|nr:AmmeMemoRadiSam system protein B [Ignavibacteriaceae bacterium]